MSQIEQQSNEFENLEENIFENDKINQKDALSQVIDSCKSLSKDIGDGLNEIKAINRKTHSLALNARIEANRAGEEGKSFLIVSNSIDELATKISDAVDFMHAETVQEMTKMTDIIQKQSVNITGSRLSTLALTNMDLIDRNLFERSADIRWWATDNILVKTLSEGSENNLAGERLSIILDAYTLYHDLILCDMNGTAIASGKNDKFGMTGRNFSEKEWFINAVKTSSGAEYGFQSVKHSPSIDDFTVVYSALVHEDGDTQKRPIGVLAAVFKWTELVQTIVNETPLNENEKDTTRVCIVDDSGVVLADTGNKILKDKIDFSQKELLFKTLKDFTITSIDSKNYLIAHGGSSGFEGYYSGLHCVIVQEFLEDYCVDASDDNHNESLEGVIQLTNQLSDETFDAIKKIQDINEETHILALNAAIEASRAGNTGKGFGVISEYMGKLSSDTSGITKNLSNNCKKIISDMHEILTHNSDKVRGEQLSNMALTNIDLIDRMLYERTADVRWWATDSNIVNAFDENISNFNVIETLGTILRYYTIYQDIVLCNLEGKIIANGNPEFKVVGKNMANSEWFQSACSTGNGNEYGFETVHKSPENDKAAITYSCKIHRNGDVADEPVGILGIVFKWEDETNQIISNTPLNDDMRGKSRICIMDDNGKIFSDSQKKFLDTLEFDNFENVLLESKNYHYCKTNDQTICVGHGKSPGYNGYATGFHSVIIFKE